MNKEKLTYPYHNPTLTPILSPSRLQDEYKKGDWLFAVTEVITYKPQNKYLPCYGLDVRHDFTTKPNKEKGTPTPLLPLPPSH